MILNLILLFCCIYIPLTALDTWTTFISLDLGYRETNPLTDTSSPIAMMFPDIIFFCVGILLIILAVLFYRESLSIHLREDLENFRNIFNGFKGVILLFVLGLPFLVAVGRIVPVLNNTMYITLGWSITGNTAVSISEFAGWPVHFSNALINAFVFMVICRPVTGLIYIVSKKGLEREDRIQKLNKWWGV